MAKGILDDAKIDVPCPSCGKVTAKTIGWLKSHRQFDCPSCGQNIGLESAQFRREIAKADRAVEQFKKAFKKR